MNDSTKEESFLREAAAANVSSTHPAAFKQTVTTDSLVADVNAKLYLND